MYGSPLTSTATRLIVPPVNRYGRSPGIILGDRIADVAADGEALAGDHVAARLGLDATLADLGLTVVQRQDAFRDGRRPAPFLLERRREDQVLADRQVDGGDDFLFEHADEAVHVVEAVILHVERVTAEA